MKKLIPILIIAAIAIGFIGWVLPKTDLLGANTSATNSNWSAVSYRVGTRNSNTEVISSSRGASFVTLAVSGETNIGNLIDGGGELALTAGATSTTVTAANVCDYNLHTFASPVVDSTTTLPTASALASDCLTAVGDSKTIVFYNTGLAASTTVFATSTGIRLFLEDDTGADGTISGTQRATLKFTRVDEGSSTTVDVYLTELNDL